MAPDLSTTDELDDLETIAVTEAGLRPLLAGDDAAIQFDCNPVGFQAQLFQQTGEREWSVKVTLFPIDLEHHLDCVRRSLLEGAVFLENCSSHCR